LIYWGFEADLDRIMLHPYQFYLSLPHSQMAFLFNKKKSSQDLIKSVEKNLKELNDALAAKDEKNAKKV